MLEINYGSKFKKDYKRVIKRPNHKPELFAHVVKMLAEEKPLPAKYRDHALTGNFIGFRECHILPDWLLIYKVERETLTLVLTRTGSHSDLF